MRRIKKSFGYALDGLFHAFAREKNLRLFLVGYIIVTIIGIIVQLLPWEWLTLLLAGGIFASVELLNTALERLSDALDHERKLLGRTSFHAGIRATKDVAAAASLMSFVTLGVVICIVFWPYVRLYIL